MISNFVWDSYRISPTCMHQPRSAERERHVCRSSEACRKLCAKYYDRFWNFQIGGASRPSDSHRNRAYENEKIYIFFARKNLLTGWEWLLQTTYYEYVKKQNTNSEPIVWSANIEENGGRGEEKNEIKSENICMNKRKLKKMCVLFNLIRARFIFCDYFRNSLFDKIEKFQESFSISTLLDDEVGISFSNFRYFHFHLHVSRAHKAEQKCEEWQHQDVNIFFRTECDKVNNWKLFGKFHSNDFTCCQIINDSIEAFTSNHGC